MNKKMYGYTNDISRLEKIISESMGESSNLSLIIFKNVCDQVVRLSRVCMLERGHIMFVGQQGMGKRSITELTSIVIGAKLATILVNKK